MKALDKLEVETNKAIQKGIESFNECLPRFKKALETMSEKELERNIKLINNELSSMVKSKEFYLERIKKDQHIIYYGLQDYRLYLGCVCNAVRLEKTLELIKVSA